MGKDFHGYYTTFFGGTLFRWVDFAKIRILKKELSNNRKRLKILDLGCGTAEVSSKLSEEGLEIVGADSNPALLKIAEKKGVETIVVDFDRRLQFKNNFFDVVMMIDTLEHVKSRETTIKEVKRILKKDGRIIIFTPPYDSITWLLAERIANFLTQSKSDHKSPFTRESLEYLLKANFKKYRIGTTNFGLTMFGIAKYKRD